MKRVTLPLDILSEKEYDEMSDEQIISVIKKQLNYGWKFVSLKHLSEKAAYDYRITLEWEKDDEPTIPPFDNKK